MRYAANKTVAFAYVFIVTFALVALCGCDNNEYYRANPATAEKSEEVFNPANIEYGTLIDSRDGQKYKTVKIGDRWWLAKNLNYAADSSYCYNDEPDSCAIYGRLYPWTVAMQLDTIYNKLNVTYTETIKGAHQGICPEGWHLPSAAEFQALQNAVFYGSALRSREEWSDKGSQGWNLWGFNAYPAGGRESGDYFDKSLSSYMWTADKSVFWLRYYSEEIQFMPKDNKTAFSVRCLED